MLALRDLRSSESPGEKLSSRTAILRAWPASSSASAAAISLPGKTHYSEAFQNHRQMQNRTDAASSPVRVPMGTWLSNSSPGYPTCTRPSAQAVALGRGCTWSQATSLCWLLPEVSEGREVGFPGDRAVPS